MIDQKTRNYDIFVAKTPNYDIFVAKIYDYALIDTFWGFPRFIDSPTSYAALVTTLINFRKDHDQSSSLKQPNDSKHNNKAVTSSTNQNIFSILTTLESLTIVCRLFLFELYFRCIWAIRIFCWKIINMKSNFVLGQKSIKRVQTDWGWGRILDFQEYLWIFDWKPTKPRFLKDK